MAKYILVFVARNLGLILMSAFLLPGGRLLGQTSAPESSSAPDTATASSSVLGTQNNSGGFFSRFGKAYWTDWTGTQVESATPPRRGFPAPVDSPPFPFSDWPYGGSPVIGVPDTSGGPLMTAIYGSKYGKGWENSRIKMYGWINAGFNLSTSDKHYGKRAGGLLH
jgi:hypothetical protein